MTVLHGLLGLLALVGVASFTAAVAQPANDERYVPPRTSDGQPDLQGVWLNNSATPLERPAALAGRALLTDEEVAEFRRRYAEIVRSPSSDFYTADRVFEGILAGATLWRSRVTTTGGAAEQIELEIDHRTSLITDPPDGRIPPLTPSARERQARVDAANQNPQRPSDLDNSTRCLSWRVPRLGGLYGAGLFGWYRIFQVPDVVVLYMETGHEARIIPLDGRPHLNDGLRQRSGDSRGHWEGNTLVVETTNFAPGSYFLGAMDNLHLVERFTRVAPDRIDYEMTLTDPTTWERPWSALIPLRRREQQLYEFACHEGNYEVIRAILRNQSPPDRE